MLIDSAEGEGTETRPLDTEERRRVEDVVDYLSEQGLRCLAVACRPVRERPAKEEEALEQTLEEVRAPGALLANRNMQISCSRSCRTPPE